MATRAPASASTEITYLKEFTKLAPHTYLHEPTKVVHHQAHGDGSSAGASPPDLILLCTWMGAATKHIDKYTVPYVAKYPSATILLVRSELPDLTWRPKSQQIQRMQPAVTVLKKLVDLHGTKKLNVLLHVFSNGGSWTACMLATAYSANKAATGLKTNLPVSAMIFDSAPSLPHARITYNAMIQTLGKSVIVRLIGGYIIWAFIMVAWVLDHISYRQNILINMRAKLNDTSGPFLGGAKPRMYICSTTDKMIPMEDVIAHAEEAKNALKKDGVMNVDNIVNVEEFKASVHVGHMMVDRTRYWRLVDELWAQTNASM